MAEARVNGGVEPINFPELRDALVPRLSDYPNSPDAQEALTLLGNLNEHEIVYRGCVERARAGLDEIARNHIDTVKGRFCTQVYRGYPAGSEGAPELMSPKRFIRDHGLDSRIRPELREAQGQAVSASRDKLVEEIQGDSHHEELDTVVTDEELQVGMAEEVQAKLDALRARVQEIEKLMPIVTTPLGRVGRQAMRVMHHQRAVAVDTITMPADHTRERGQLDSAIFGLKSVLKELFDGETVIARALIERYAERVRDHIERELIGHYEELEASALTRLPTYVEAAYVSAARLGPRYQPQEKTGEDADTPSSAIAPSSGNGDTVKEDSEGEIVRTVRIANPFEWHRDETVELHIVSEGGQVTIYGSAMTPNAQSISETVRADDQQAAKRLDDMWSRIVQVERQGAALNHNLISKIRTDFHGLSVHYFRNNKKNGLRTYYAKTKLSQFPELARVAAAEGATMDSELIILLAETDKAHQEKILEDINARWRWQR